MARTPATRLRHTLESPGLVEAVGAYDVLTMRAIEHLGFDVGYVAGSVTAATMYGLPDIGQVEPTELVSHAGRLARAVDLPVIADLDDGGGNPFRIHRTVRLAEAAGIAGIHIEDFDYSLGKHLLGADGKVDLRHGRLHSLETSVKHVEAAVSARSNPDTVLIMRTDAALVETVPDAIERSNAYAEAGADMVFVYGLSTQDMPAVLGNVRAPVVASVGLAAAAAGTYTPENVTSWQAQGLQLLLHPFLPALAGFHGAWAALRQLREGGDVSALAQEAGASLDLFLSVFTRADAWRGSSHLGC